MFSATRDVVSTDSDHSAPESISASFTQLDAASVPTVIDVGTVVTPPRVELFV